MADYSFLDLVPGFAEKEAQGWHHVGPIEMGHPLLNASGHVTMGHVVFSGLVFVLILLVALAVRGKFLDRETAVVPDGKFTLRNFVETVFGAVYQMMADMMGEVQARRYFPLIATLSLWIFFSNCMGLVPGFLPPTQNLNTSLAPAIVVFVVYNIAGVREHGVINYMKHFAGPVWFIAPLMLVIEIIGHAFRPISLGVRLTGNMTGDHMVLGAFGNLANEIAGIPLLLPIPFLFLGLLVCTIQTLVFCLLSSVYISLSVEHAEH